MEQNIFDKKIKPVLLWMGTIVASVMCFAYVLMVFVLIEGFKAEKLLNTSVFSLVTAIVGFCVMQMLKIQGQAFAKEIPQNKEIYDKYCKREAKERKYYSMRRYWTTSILSDILTKCIMLGITSVGIVYIMIEGSGDYSLLFLSAVNLLMFVGLGLMALVKTYDFYNDSFVPYMLHEIEKAEKETEEKEKQEVERKAEVIVEGCDNFCDSSTKNLIQLEE